MKERSDIAYRERENRWIRSYLPMKSHWLDLDVQSQKGTKMTIFVVKYTKEKRFFLFLFQFFPL